ncbi:flagellar assembly peptidoglycan hydrolase FlgJ [Enterobacteriaceae bacterium ESL0689]|nr:flagellar assembly peptidoglycan hydrolase FlgJ [Enterobacteriaceae bacterium ESL0689]
MSHSLLKMAGAAYDAQALNGLKRDAAADPQGNLRQVAQQVEGIFVQMMLKSMRSTLPEDGILSSHQTRLFTSMYDQQIAQQVSQKGLGLAEVIVRQMNEAHSQPSEMAGITPMALDNEILQTLPVQALEQVIRRAVPRLPAISRDNHAFIARLAPHARIASQQSGIPHQLIVAQAALESGWGEREIPTRDGKPSHNLFGIKAGSSWQGRITEIITTEFEQGIAKKVKAKFRAYNSYTEAISDYIKLLTNNPRYAEVAAARTPEQGAHALQRAGYATDPHYSKKLVTVIQQIKRSGEQAVKAYMQDLDKLF